MTCLLGGIGFCIIPETSAMRILQLKARKCPRQSRRRTSILLHLHSLPNPSLCHDQPRTHPGPLDRLHELPLRRILPPVRSLLHLFYLERGWFLGISALLFCSFVVGTIIGSALTALFNSHKLHLRLSRSRHQPRSTSPLRLLLVSPSIFNPSILWISTPNPRHRLPRHGTMDDHLLARHPLHDRSTATTSPPTRLLQSKTLHREYRGRRLPAIRNKMIRLGCDDIARLFFILVLAPSLVAFIPIEQGLG